jgi:signal transduction histidine kinase
MNPPVNRPNMQARAIISDGARVSEGARPILGHEKGWLLEFWLRRWGGLSLDRKSLVAAILVVGLALVTLGYWVEKRVRAGWIQGLAETGALYMEGFLAPHIQTLDVSRVLPQESHDKIASLLVDTSLGKRVAVINIWDLEGNLILSTYKTWPYSRLPDSYFGPILNKIRSGQIVANFDTGSPLQEVNARYFPQKFLEIYAPLYSYETKEVIAVGEFYEYNNYLKEEFFKLRYSLWFLIFNVGVIISVLLAIIVKKARRVINLQRSQLEANFARAAALAKRNNALRRTADRARLNASVLNESYLASIGADIHDGPIQLLSLMMLKLPGAHAQSSPGVGNVDTGLAARKELEPLIQLTLADLRNLSAGLVLPEVEGLSVADTIEMAITRHQQQTGTMVAREVSGLPEHVPSAIRVCAYRIVQEALTNAFKHAGGQGQRVSARLAAGMLEIVVTDSGKGPQSELSPAPNGKIGLRGMENRIKALRGSLVVNRLVNGGTEIRATLPVHS